MSGKLLWSHYCELLPISEEKPVLESDLEKALVRKIEDFLLELGNGVMFVGTQQRVTINNTHYYVDTVFYNKLFHAYVLIELKTFIIVEHQFEMKLCN